MKTRRVVFQCEIDSTLTARELRAVASVMLFANHNDEDWTDRDDCVGLYQLDERPVITIVKQRRRRGEGEQ